ncbi:MAG: TonB-dependent receptor [Prevotellaceae bacterium]|jgi:TonB-linked SusC/RagA family outer membrane protein|nr:TonB-dependent receptor [Prevotellaceae bacterium]
MRKILFLSVACNSYWAGVRLTNQSRVKSGDFSGLMKFAKKLTLLLVCFMMSAGLVFAQNKQVTGLVKDDAGEPVTGASVVVKGTSVGILTGSDGKFSLDVPQSATTIVVSYIGFKEAEINAAPYVEVVLEQDVSALDEVVVVAYGTAKKSSFTGSAAVIDKKKLEKRTVSNVTKALDGQVAGVVSTSGGGQPGDGANVRVRGYASINASSSPLYVVDGIPFNGSISSINPADIESMTVLKDASAGALYGARGANGVIIITTKRGVTGQADVNFKATYGWSSRAIKKYDMVNQREYVQLNYEALRNGYIFNNNYTWDAAKAQAIADLGSTLGGEIYNPFKNYTWQTIIDPATEQVQADAVAAWDEDWIDEISNYAAPRQEYQFSIRGGNDKTQNLLSLGYIKEEGVLKNTSFERFSGRGSIDYQAKEWLKSGLNTSISMSKQNYSMYDGSSYANVWYSAQFMGPIYPVYVKDASGNDVLKDSGERELDYGPGRPKMSNFSSIATLYDDKSNIDNDNVSTRAYITLGSDDDDYGVFKGLKFSANLGADYRGQNVLYYYNMFHGNFSSKGGIIEKASTRMLSYTFNQLLTYKRTFADDHNLDLLAGHESYVYQYNYLYGQKSGLIEGIYELDPATTVDGAGSYQKDYRIESYLARLNYNFKEKYYFDASFRSDGSSRFHKDNRWGTFWSVGANWRISEENFLKDNVDWINNLSLKVSYGVQGNDDILDSNSVSDYYLWQSFYNLTWPNANLGGAVVSSLENRDVTWEKNYNLNTGIEARLFGNRLDISFEYFDRKTKDLLLSFPMALSTGFSGYNANIGDMSNKGFEASISGLIVDTELKVRLNLMVSKVKNEVLRLTKDSDVITSGLRVIEVGKEIYTYYMSKSAGVDPATGAQLYWAYDKDEDGNITKEYVTSDYQKATNSKYYLGSRIPKLFGSIGTEITFRGFDFSALTTYSIGGKVYDGLYNGAMNIMYGGDTWHKNKLRRWQKPGDITDVPRAMQNPAYAQNDNALIDASYFAIKNVTLGYTLPQKLLKKAKVNSVRVFATLDNFMLFSHLDGMDPQFNFSGGTDYVYSPSRTISLGVDIHF